MQAFLKEKGIPAKNWGGGGIAPKPPCSPSSDGPDRLAKHSKHSLYIRAVSSQRLLSTSLIQFKLLYGPFGQSSMQSTLDFCPRPARKETSLLYFNIYCDSEKKRADRRLQGTVTHQYQQFPSYHAVNCMNKKQAEQSKNCVRPKVSFTPHCTSK